MVLKVTQYKFQVCFFAETFLSCIFATFIESNTEPLRQDRFRELAAPRLLNEAKLDQVLETWVLSDRMVDALPDSVKNHVVLD